MSVIPPTVSPLELPLADEEQGIFIRLEDKYLLTAGQAAELLPLMEAHLENASPIPNTRFTLIESVYFDNADISVLKNYLDQKPVRSKLRTRRYGPNGSWSKDLYLELKSKEDGVSKKNRVQITDAEVECLSEGRALQPSAALEAVNAGLDARKIRKRLQSVNAFTSAFDARPFCRVAYSRVAYEKDDFRVTLDRGLEFTHLEAIPPAVSVEVSENAMWMERLLQTQKLFSERSNILEVKHAGKIPEWMTSFLAEQGILEVSFSKYCQAMSYAVAGDLLGRGPQRATLATAGLTRSPMDVLAASLKRI